MKKYFLLICLICLIVGPSGLVYAQETTPSAEVTSTASATPAEKKAQELLDRVATKVAQIVDSKKRTFRGEVTSISTSSYTVVTSEGNRSVFTNDATEFYRIRANRKTEIAFDDIEKGENIAAIGAIDPSNNTMTAKQVVAKIKRHVFAGPIEALEDDVVTVNGEKIDLSDASYQHMDSEGIVETATLSDYEVGDLVFIIAHSPDEETKIYSSLKSLVIKKG